ELRVHQKRPRFGERDRVLKFTLLVTLEKLGRDEPFRLCRSFRTDHCPGRGPSRETACRQRKKQGESRKGQESAPRVRLASTRFQMLPHRLSFTESRVAGFGAVAGQHSRRGPPSRERSILCSRLTADCLMTPNCHCRGPQGIVKWSEQDLV